MAVPLILLAYDDDAAGEQGAARLGLGSQRMHRVRVPWGKDLTEFHQQQGNLYSWLARELRQSAPEDHGGSGENLSDTTC